MQELGMMELQSGHLRIYQCTAEIDAKSSWYRQLKEQGARPYWRAEKLFSTDTQGRVVEEGGAYLGDGPQSTGQTNPSASPPPSDPVPQA